MGISYCGHILSRVQKCFAHVDDALENATKCHFLMSNDDKCI